MWTTKEVIIISLATGLAFCFATIYSQRKMQQYIDNKVSEKSSNPLSSILTRDMASSLGQVAAMNSQQNSVLSNDSMERQQSHLQDTPPASIPVPSRKEKKFHEPPPGSGERWTPLPIEK